MKCIYCKNEITETTSSIEHVFPQAFGCPDSFTINCVCRACNNGFGGTIDRWLASDSLEAIRRLQIFGSRSGTRVPLRRLRIQFPMEERYAQFQGATVWIDYDRLNNIIVSSQVGLVRLDGQREFFTKDDLEIDENVERAKTCSKKDIRIIAPSQAEHDNMVDLIIIKGIVPSYTERESGGIPEELIVDGSRIMIQGESTIDRDIQRAIAKIAFNYLARERGENFVLSERFDPIRNFINGSARGYFVMPQREPILYDETANWRHFSGHLFTLDRTDNNKLIAKISLFNGLSYHVLLASSMGLIFYRLRVGVAYDIEAKETKNMFPVQNRILPDFLDHLMR